MKIRVKTIGKRGNTVCSEIKDLTIIGINGIEYTADLITASDFWNDETENYEMVEEDFDWWKEYITNYENDAEEIIKLAEEIELEESEIYNMINDYITNDLNDEHDIKQFVIKKLRESEEYAKINN